MQRETRREASQARPNEVVDDESTSPEETEQNRPRRASSFSRHRMLHFVPHFAFLMSLSQAQRQDARSLEDVVLELGSDQNQGSIAPTSHCGKHELQYLESIGCLDLPPPHVIAALINAYFNVFHPFFPIVEKSKFLRSIQPLENLGSTSANMAPPHRAITNWPRSKFTSLKSRLQSVAFPSGPLHSNWCCALRGHPSRRILISQTSTQCILHKSTPSV